MIFRFHTIIVMALIVFVCHVFPADAAEGSKVISPGLVNPHNEKGDCSKCHVAPEDTLNGWFVLKSTKRQLISDRTRLCLKCHTAGSGHGVGKTPKINREGLPLEADGTINCATTCHDMHLPPVDNKVQQIYHLRYPDPKLCTSCHNK